MTEAEIAKMLGQNLMWVSNHASVGANLISEVRAMMSMRLPSKDRLSFTSAIRVSRMKPEHQARGATLYIKRDAKAADQIIRSQAEELGIKTRAKRTPRDDFINLKNFTHRVERELTAYKEMPQSFFDSMFLYRSEEDPILLAENLRKLAEEEMPKLISAIRKALENKKIKK